MLLSQTLLTWFGTVSLVLLISIPMAIKLLRCMLLVYVFWGTSLWLQVPCVQGCPPVSCPAPGCTEDCSCEEIFSIDIISVSCGNRGISSVTKSLIDSMPNFTRGLNLSGNNIQDISPGTFSTLTILRVLALTNNRIKRLRRGVFKGLGQLINLNLDFNEIETIETGTFQDCAYVDVIDLGSNQLQTITNDTFKDLSLLSILFLSSNNISHIAKGAFQDLKNVHTMFVEQNNLTNLQQGSLDGLINLRILDISSSGITYIEDNAFNNLVVLQTLGLAGNKLRAINDRTLMGLQSLVFLNLENNPIRVISNQAFQDTTSLTLVNMVGTSIEVLPTTEFWAPRNLSLQILPSGDPPRIVVYGDGYMTLAMFNAGFICTLPLNPFEVVKLDCYMCPMGSFTWFPLCFTCPAGGFYLDVMGYVGNLHCKECPSGRYVHPDSAPGKDVKECTSCPEGTQHDKPAKFRGCPCEENFYRLDRFGSCMQCPSLGLTCQNESVLLKRGYYWRWESREVRQHYDNFTFELQIQNDSYDRERMRFNQSLPKVYPCPVAASCLGGLESSCSEGYQGPLCAVCSKGYYKMISTCQKCPSLPWLIGQILLFILFAFVVVLPLIFGKKMVTSGGRSVTDIVLARLKILVSFYQVTSGTVDAFSYVEWPTPLLQLISYAKFLQLNLLQIAPVNCFTNRIKVTTFTSFLLNVIFIAVVLIWFFVYYQSRKCYHSKIKRLNHQETTKAASETKEFCVRYVFLLLFIIYPTVAAQVFQILPSSCQKICVDSQENSCKSYLVSDFTLECFTDNHNRFTILAFTMLFFVAGFPLIILSLMWKYLRSKNQRTNSEQSNEIATGMSFLYENYSDNCWFWEVLELARKLTLASVIVLIGQDSRTNLGVGAMMSGFYVVLFASYQPISDRFEHWLQLMSLLATCANMNIGMLLRIPQESVSSGLNTELEATGISVLLISVNLLVTGMITARYTAATFSVIRAMRRRPQCSMECCLFVISAINDAGEDVILFQPEERSKESNKVDVARNSAQ